MAAIESIFRQLVDCLEEQEKIIDGLIASGQEQFKALRANDLEGLLKTVSDQQSGGLKMEEAEQRRLDVQAVLEEALFVDKGSSTLNGLVPFAPEPLKTALQERLDVLRKKIKKLKEITLLNSSLIKNILLLNERLIKLLTPGGSLTYDPKGGIGSKAQDASVLNKEI